MKENLNNKNNIEDPLRKKHGWGEFSNIKVVKRATRVPDGWQKQKEGEDSK